MLAALPISSYAQLMPFRRVRPGDPGWPDQAQWQILKAATGDNLIRVQSPLATCAAAAAPACAALFHELKNPYFIGDTPGLTETSGWAGAWSSEPSVYAVHARSAAHVAAAVNFARVHRLRLVVKGGGHSYQGNSNAADSLLVWTRALDSIQIHDAFVPSAAPAGTVALPAVTVGAGAIWMRVYNEVMTRAGRYVQGGGCATVGVAGLVQSGGFGSFSKNFGPAAAGLLEAEIVTADGTIRIANAGANPDLFWALKGGGGGTLGVVTRVTLRTHDLPSTLGGVFGAITAKSDTAFRRLLVRFVAFYADALCNPAWGEMASIGDGNRLSLGMVFHGLSKPEAEAVWAPFVSWVSASPDQYAWDRPIRVAALPGRHFWDAAFYRAHLPQAVIADDRANASPADVFWRAGLGEAGWFIHGYDSAWLPATLLHPSAQDGLADALFAASRIWKVELHFNKGLAGAPPQVIADAAQTAMHPAVQTAFGLAIIAAGEPPAFPELTGHEPDLAAAHRDAANIAAAMAEIRKVAGGNASYLAESDYFNPHWQNAFWGDNYPRLRTIKRHYDPDGLFFTHHGVDSEGWSSDGFIRQ